MEMILSIVSDLLRIQHWIQAKRRNNVEWTKWNRNFQIFNIGAFHKSPKHDFTILQRHIHTFNCQKIWKRVSLLHILNHLWALQSECNCEQSKGHFNHRPIHSTWSWTHFRVAPCQFRRVWVGWGRLFDGRFCFYSQRENLVPEQHRGNEKNFEDGSGVLESWRINHAKH